MATEAHPSETVDQKEEIKHDVELITIKAGNNDPVVTFKSDDPPPFSNSGAGTKSRRLSGLKSMPSSKVLLPLDEQNKMLENMNLGCCPSGHRLIKTKSNRLNNFGIEFVCDYCWEMIEEVRYQCRMCDFDFCAKCYLKIRLGNKAINYLKIAKWVNDISPVKKKQYWKQITVKVKKSNPEQWDKLLARAIESKRQKKRRQKEDKHRQIQQLLRPIPALASLAETEQLTEDTTDNPLSDPYDAEQKESAASSRRHSVASSSRIGYAIYNRIPFIQHLDNEDEMQKFLAHFIVLFLQNTSNKAHQARVDVDSVMSFVKDDAVFIFKNLRDKKTGLNYRFFISKHFTKLLTKLHYHKATLNEYILSPFGYKMKMCSTNPPNVSRHVLECALCQRKLDLTSFFGPNHFAFDYKTKTCLCPAHATCAGAAAQSRKFVSEVNVFLDIIRVYQRLKIQYHSELADLWDSATKIQSKEDNLSEVVQFVNICVALGDTAKRIDGAEEEEKKEPMDDALVALKKHAQQCANWIFSNKTRKKDVNKQKFLESNVLIDILLDYYWEFSEYEVKSTSYYIQKQSETGEEKYDVWKYINFWLNQRVNMTPKEFYHRVIDDGDSKYLKKLVAFLYGQQECEANLISDKNVILDHFCEYLDEGTDTFEDKLSSINVQHLAGIQPSSVILANMKYLDDRMDNLFLKKDLVDYDATKDPLSFDGRNESLDLNWLELAGFIRNVGSEYMQLLIKKKFETEMSLHNLDLRTKQRSSFASKYKLRILLYHFINTFCQLNRADAPRLITPQMFIKSNSVELLLKYIVGEAGWACESERCNVWKKRNKFKHGDEEHLDRDEVELKEDEIGIYKDLYHQNTIELSIWSLIYETKLTDILVNYHYARKRLERANGSYHQTPGHVVDLPLDATRLCHFPVHASRSHRRNRSVQKAVQENEGGAHYRVNFIRMDDNDVLRKDDVKLSFHYRLIRRNHRVQGWNKSCVGPNGEFVVRFRVSAFTDSIYIRLATSPNAFQYEIEIKPTIDAYSQHISYCAITMEEHRKKEENERLWLPYNNHHGVWFTLHCSKTRFFLLADYMDDLAASRLRVEDVEHCTRLICMKRIRSNHMINWIGFAALNDRLTISTPDTDTCILASWVKWLKATGLHKYSEAYNDIVTDYNEEHEENADQYKSEGEVQMDQVQLKKMLKHTHSTFLIDMIDNSAFTIMKKLKSDDFNVNSMLNVQSKEDNQRYKEEEGIFQLLERIFKLFRPTFRLVPSLSPGCEFAVEMKCNKPLLTSVIRETFETDPEITQILGDDFIILHQIVYDKLQIDSDIWFFLSEHVADICDLDEIDKFTAKTAVAATATKSELLRSFLLYAFRPTQSREEMETFISSLTEQTASFTHKRTQTQRGYSRYGDNPAIEMREINNGEARVVRIYDYNTTNMLTFSFSTITKINLQLFQKLMEIRDSLDSNQHSKNKNFIEHEKSNYDAIIKRLTRNPIWPYIEVKRSRAGTLERLTANKVEYVWRGGTTALLSDSALPMQMSMQDDHDHKECPGDDATYQRLLYYEVELEKVGVDKSINVGATLGKHFSYFTSSSQPGLRPCSWGLSGDLGILYDENKNKTNYGPSFQNGLIVGCGFVLTTPEAFDPDDLDADKYTSNLFFTYNGMALKTYPDQDANESLLPRSVLHKLFAVTSTGSESCKLKFNFGPRFKYDKANEMIANYFTVAKKQYEKRRDAAKLAPAIDLPKQLQPLHDEKEEEKDMEEATQPRVVIKADKVKIQVTKSDGEVADGRDVDPEDLKEDLLTEVEEEILTELILQFETNDQTGSNKTVIDDEDEEAHTNQSNMSEDAYMKLKYEALFHRVIMSYYFYLTPFEKLDSTTMYELLVQFHLLNLATIVSDVGVNGHELIHLEETVKKWVLSDDTDDEKYRVALLLLNTRTKHRELLKEFRNVMSSISDSLYRENIVPQNVKQLNAMSLSNIPPTIRQLALNKNDAYSQWYLLKLWRLIVHQRRLNTSGSGKGDMTSLKQEFLLDFIAYFLSNGNTIELITQLLISWSSGNFNVDRDCANFSGKYELSILLSGFIRGSNNPISAAIQVGQFLEENRRSFPEIEAEIIEINHDVQRMAVDILEDIHSNRLAIIALEANSSLDIALDYQLQEFISSDRVQYLKQLMWTRSGDALLTSANTEHFRDTSHEIATWWHVIMDEYAAVFRKFFAAPFKHTTRKYLYEFFFTKRNQMSWFFSPVGKMQIEFFVYIVYLFLLIYVANSTSNDGVYAKTLSAPEWAFWICNSSFIFAEFRSMFARRRAYWTDPARYINIFITFLYIGLGLVRIFGWTEMIGQCSNGKREMNKCLDKPLNIIYIVLWFLLIMSTLVKMSYMLFVFYNMGLLIRALFRMFKDVANFVLLIVIILFGFALSIHLSTNGEAPAFVSVWTSMRALFYAMLGEIEYEQLIEDTECQAEASDLGITWDEHGCLNNFGTMRSITNSMLLFFWMVMASILLINFIIAVMNNTYELVQNEVGQFVKFNRMRVCRENDRKLPTIPPPFQIIIVVFKYIWFYLFEPLIFLFTGRFLNEETWICTFTHMKYFYKEQFYRRKVEFAPWFRKPFFIEFNDHIHGTPPKPPVNICQRFRFLRQAAHEAQRGLLYVNQDHATEKNDPSIWICGYCRCTNYEFERQKRRATSYSDIIRYYKYNDLLPPEFGFNDVDVQFLEHITPPLCDNCFRLRFWVQRHVVIESLIAFYLYFVLSFIVVKLPMFLLLLCMALVVAVLGFVIALFYGLFVLIYLCFSCSKRCCRNTLCSCCVGGPDIEYKFKEQMERHAPLNKQRLITSGPMVARLDQSLRVDVKNDGLDHFRAGDVRELPVIKDAEDHFAHKRRRVSEYDGAQAVDTYDDSDDDTSSYKTLSGNNKYDLVLVIVNTDFGNEERDNFIRLLHGADGLLNAERRNQNDFQRRYHHRFQSIFYPKNVESIVIREIMMEGNQRIVLAHDRYRKCIKFKKNVSKLMERMMIENAKNNIKYVLPLFEIKVMPTRHSLSYNFGQKQTLKANYQQKQSILATQQTRTRYQFQYNPVLKRINHYK